MLSPTAQAAKETLEALNTAIEESESNLRILAKINDPRRLEVQRKLRDAIAKRNQVLAAIKEEDETHG